MVVAKVAAAAETTAGSGMMTSDAAEKLKAVAVGGTCSLKFDDEQELCVAISRNFAHRQ